MRQRFITSGKAAKLIGVSTSTLRNWHVSGEFRADVLLPSGHRKYDLERVRDFAAAMREAADNEGDVK